MRNEFWLGPARHGMAGPGKARQRMANTLSFASCRGQKFCAARRGDAWHGMARLGKANTLRFKVRA